MVALTQCIYCRTQPGAEKDLLFYTICFVLVQPAVVQLMSYTDAEILLMAEGDFILIGKATIQARYCCK